jgi:hypothetical protein
MKLTQATAKVLAAKAAPIETAPMMTAIRGADGFVGLYMCWGDCPR